MNRNERLIVLTMLQAAQAKGWELTHINDDEGDQKVTSLEAAFELANNLDLCRWILRLPKEKHPEGHVGRGWVLTIFGNGNDGLDVISDYTTNLDSFYEQTDPEVERQRRPHGFMGEVSEFVEELERYWIGDQAHKGEVNKIYFQRDLQELAAPRMVLALQQLVAMHGIRGPLEDDPEADALVPAARQPAEIAAVMQLLQEIRFPVPATGIPQQ